MITQKKRRGPPKSVTPPLSGKERVRRHREKVKNNGGSEVRVTMEQSELLLLEVVRESWNLPSQASNADVLKAIMVVMAGHTLITTGKRVKSHLEVHDINVVEDNDP